MVEIVEHALTDAPHASADLDRRKTHFVMKFVRDWANRGNPRAAMRTPDREQGELLRNHDH